jgi:hypothetical protein
MRTELASGAWVEHRSIDDLKMKDHDAVSRAVKMAMPMTAEGEIDLSGGVSLGGDLQINRRNAAIARIVTAWSYDFPVPVIENKEIRGEESIGEIPIDDGLELAQLLEPYMAKLGRRPDPKGTTTSSSNGLSRASAAPGSPPA